MQDRRIRQSKTVANSISSFLIQAQKCRDIVLGAPVYPCVYVSKAHARKYSRVVGKISTRGIFPLILQAQLQPSSDLGTVDCRGSEIAEALSGIRRGMLETRKTANEFEWGNNHKNASLRSRR